jgi:transketolase
MRTENLREFVGHALVKVSEAYEKMVVVNADLRASLRTNYFSEAHPEKFVEVGLGEQNMIGVAAGLATCGLVPFVLTFGVFASKQVAQQISICVSYSRTNVKIIAGFSGIFTGKTGATHQAIEDIALMRAMPNMVVIDTADAVETLAAFKFAAEYQGPVYIRTGRDIWPVYFDEATYEFELGKSILMREGTDVTILNSGLLLGNALNAAEMLAKEGIHARVINMPFIKPLDTEAVERAAAETGAIVTVENHNIMGGFGGAVAEVLVEHCPVPMQRIGIRDVHGESASNEDLMRKYHLTAEDIVNAAKEVISRKK